VIHARNETCEVRCTNDFFDAIREEIQCWMFPLYIDLTPIVCISVWEGRQTFLFPILGNHSKEAARQETNKKRWVRLFFFLVPSCAKQASLSFLAQVSEDKPLLFIRICLSSPTTSSGKESLMYSDGPLYSFYAYFPRLNEMKVRKA
jgi:hypothetical protein